MTKANLLPTLRALRTTRVASNLVLDQMLLSGINDPCYLHEISYFTQGYSRKQIEKTMNRLLAEHQMVAYGRSSRWLYASPRSIVPVLFGMPSIGVRFLQFMPLQGAVLLGDIEDRSPQSGKTSNMLAEAGLVLRLPGKNKMVCLTPEGEAARANLGTGLALKKISTQRMNEEGGQAHKALEALARQPLQSLRKYTSQPERLIKQGTAQKDEHNIWHITAAGAEVVRARNIVRRIDRAEQ